ncbi:hypothetical protein APHAL10511_001878 [Amanita phalloides]|nr:hypothetical protein APHAL10511_001878 [Amanita phalloides]
MIRLFLLSAIPLVTALPIHRPQFSPNAVTFLAVLSAILSFLTLLYVAKLFFRKSRQSWFTSLGALAPSSTPKFVHAQSGILVGFFSSPAWETTVTLNVHKTLLERRQSFFAVEYPSHIRSVSSFGQILELPSLIYQPAKGFTPRPPSTLYDSAKVRRRYSLPSTVRPRTQYGRMRRSYSTKAKRGKHRKSDLNSITLAPVLPSKVVDDRVKHISPLSFSPLLDVGSCEDTNFFGPATKTVLTPPIPPYTVVNFGGTACSVENEASTLRQTFDLSLQESVKPVLSRQFTNMLSLGDLDSVQQEDSDNDQFPPLSPVAVFKLRPRQKLSTVRTRRSPPLGPSPLRTMILPENSEADISITACRAKPSTMSCNQDILNPVPEDEAATFDTAGPTNVEDGILGLIRELVEEVNDWDDSLFMDEDFKSMIENSQEISHKRRKRSLSSPPINSLSYDLDCIKDPLQRRMLSGGGQLVSFWEADPEGRNIGIAH